MIGQHQLPGLLQLLFAVDPIGIDAGDVHKPDKCAERSLNHAARFALSHPGIPIQ